MLPMIVATASLLTPLGASGMVIGARGSIQCQTFGILCGGVHSRRSFAVGAAVLCLTSAVRPAAAYESGTVERDMSKSASRETRFGYKDDMGVKSYSAVQRAWESSNGKTTTEIMMAARGAVKRETDSPPESERSKKRRAMAGCKEEAYRKLAAASDSEASCNSRVLGGDVQFMLDVLDAD